MSNSSKKSLLETLENSFAAAALTEASLDTAQEFLKQRESSTVEQAEGRFQAKIKQMVKSFENSFAAAAMAEGSTQMAMEFLEDGKETKSSGFFSAIAEKAKNLSRMVEESFAAAALAEGSREMAMEFLKVKTVRKHKTSLNDFLYTVGLKGVQVQFRIAMVQ